MKDHVTTIIAAVLVGLSTYFLEEQAFEARQSEHIEAVQTMSGVVKLYAGLLESCQKSKACDN